MAYGNIELEKIDGAFIERDHKKTFEYSAHILSEWDREHGFDYRVFTGPLGETRPARILKTVAYVCIDEDFSGNPVVEKWYIRHQWNREQERIEQLY